MRFYTKFMRIAVSSLTLGLVTNIVHAEASLLPKQNDNPGATINYWTPDRLKNAKPMPLPKVNSNKVSPIVIDSSESISQEGAPPTIKLNPDSKLLFSGEPENSSEIIPNDVGTGNIHFSSSRLVPLTADLSYPYSAVGKLFFTDPSSGNYVCSASVIANRIVVTAGHCVHRGSGGAGGYYTNFLFIPAYRDNTAPFQKWTWSFVIASPAWMSGGGTVPNAGDFAVLEMKDNVVSGTAQTIGSVAGKLGFATNKLAANHLHMLGYPCNLDNCQKMHQVTSQNGAAVAPNNVTYGSDMRGGSSGGPWVQNFGALAQGQAGGLNPGLNQVVGVTSWGYTSTNPKIQGASNFNATFTTMYDTICAHQSGNC